MAVLCDSTPERQVFHPFVWGGSGLGTRVLLRVGGVAPGQTQCWQLRPPSGLSSLLHLTQCGFLAVWPCSADLPLLATVGDTWHDLSHLLFMWLLSWEWWAPWRFQDVGLGACNPAFVPPVECAVLVAVTEMVA